MEQVTQADKDARRKLWGLIGPWRMGSGDIVEKAFARHRIEATRTNDQAKDEEIARLREALSRIHNTINVVGSPYHRAMVALDDISTEIKKEARAALRNVDASCG